MDQRGTGGKRSGAGVCRELQERGQSTSSAQVPKGQFTKATRRDVVIEGLNKNSVSG